jgi:fission 1 protein
LYYLSLGHYKIGNYDQAKGFNCEFSFQNFAGPSFEQATATAQLLEREPTNLQAQSLDNLIEKALKQGALLTFLFLPEADWLCTEGYMGMAIAGGAAAVGTLLLAGLIRRATRK